MSVRRHRGSAPGARAPGSGAGDRPPTPGRRSRARGSGGGAGDRTRTAGQRSRGRGPADGPRAGNLTAHAVGRVLLVGLGVGLVALLGATSGAAAAWAVPVGFAVSVIGRPPVAPRGVTALAGAGLALLTLSLGDRVGGPEVSSALTVGVLVAAAGLLRLRDDPRAPGWAALLGGAVVLAGVHVAGARGLADAAPALGGLIAGLLPMQVGEVVRVLGTSRSTSAHQPPPSAQQLSGPERQPSAPDRQPSAPERPYSTPAQERP